MEGSARPRASVVVLGGNEEWRLALEQELAEPVALPSESDVREDARIAIVVGVPEIPLNEFAGLELAVSLMAGLDALLDPPPAPTTVVARAVDPGLSRSMVETVLLHVLSAHRQTTAYRAAQMGRRWQRLPQKTTSERTVGFLGVGTLGGLAASSLVDLGFPVRGWSRTPKQLDQIECASGPAALRDLLGWSEIVVCMLPLTAATRGLLDASRLASMRPGAALINLGRGGIVSEPDLIDQLDRGHLGSAILDVFAVEPLPEDSRLWDHQLVSVFPHVAAGPSPTSGAAPAAAVVNRHLAGLPPWHPVSKERGY